LILVKHLTNQFFGFQESIQNRIILTDHQFHFHEADQEHISSFILHKQQSAFLSFRVHEFWGFLKSWLKSKEIWFGTQDSAISPWVSPPLLVWSFLFHLVDYNFLLIEQILLRSFFIPVLWLMFNLIFFRW